MAAHAPASSDKTTEEMFALLCAAQTHSAASL